MILFDPFVESSNHWGWLLLYASHAGLVVLALLHMLYQRRSPQNLMAWLFALILLPLIGVVLYWVFGSRKLLYKRNKSNIEWALTAQQQCQVTAPDQTLANQQAQLLAYHHLPGVAVCGEIKLLHADDVWLAFANCIEQAQTSIYIETYIYEWDQTGQWLAQRLIDKAQAGLVVKVLLDAVGSFDLYRHQKKLDRMRQAGVEVAFFQPFFKTFFRQQVNLRNHRKIYVFDHRTVLTGGMNVSNDYFGAQPQTAQAPRWVDLMFQMQGAVASVYTQVFQADWQYTTGHGLVLASASACQARTQTCIQVVPSGPDMLGDGLFESLLQAIYQARTDITLVTPYFIPDNSVMTALLVALKRGVKVTLISPHRSDHLIFDLGRSSYMRELAEAGGQVFLYPSGMLHAKLLLFDQKAILFGTANLDYRSLFINYEMAAWCYDNSLIARIQPLIETLQDKSQLLPAQTTQGRRLFENLTRIFAPLL